MPLYWKWLYGAQWEIFELSFHYISILSHCCSRGLWLSKGEGLQFSFEAQLAGVWLKWNPKKSCCWTVRAFPQPVLQQCVLSIAKLLQTLLHAFMPFLCHPAVCFPPVFLPCLPMYAMYESMNKQGVQEGSELQESAVHSSFSQAVWCYEVTWLSKMNRVHKNAIFPF